MEIKKVRIRNNDGTIEYVYVPYGAFEGCVFPDGSIFEKVYPDKNNFGV